MVEKKNKEKDKTVVITATFDKDSKRFHRYIIDENDQGVVGNLYVSKDLKNIPKNLSVKLRSKTKV